MEVELRNESEMPADFNWKIPLNMEACHLVSTITIEKSTTVVQVLFDHFNLKAWSAKFSHRRQDVGMLSGLALAAQLRCLYVTSSFLKHLFSGCFGRDIFHPEEGKFVQ